MPLVAHPVRSLWGSQPRCARCVCEWLHRKWDGALERYLANYGDKEILLGLKFGWPTGRLPTQKDPEPTFKNHKGARDFPEALHKYIEKESRNNAILGPFKKIPFHSRVGISPISTRPKKNTEERRVIVDLSFPHGAAVNDGMIKGNYLGFTAELRFPRTDDLAFRIAQLGFQNVMFKVDLSKYFRQISLDPADYSMTGYIIDGELYFDKVLPMGMRMAPYITQRISNAIRYIHERMNYFLLNYIDDLLGAEKQTRIQPAFQHLLKILKDINVEVAQDKIIPPTTRIEFLGVTFDSEKMTIEVTQERITEMLMELNTWNAKTTATRKELESLIGKLQFASKCIKPGRTFIARLLQWLRTMNRKSRYNTPSEALKDISWWGKCLEQYNGVSILWLTKKPEPDSLLATDACPKGFGAICGQEYIHDEFPQHLQDTNIAYLELLAVIAAVRTWKQKLQGNYFWVLVDNEAVSTIINTGASKDPLLQEGLRHLLMTAAMHNFMIKVKHIRGVDNRIPDWLSRWHDPVARQKFHEYKNQHNLTQIETSKTILDLHNKW